MARIAVRRVAANSPPRATGTLLVGLGLGAVLGFLAAEFGAPIIAAAFNQKPALTGPRGVSELVRRAQAVLDDDMVLHDRRLQVLPVGPGRIELHGWVHDRRSRARAMHLVSDAVQADAIINCLQVHGEDDDIDADEIVDEQFA